MAVTLLFGEKPKPTDADTHAAITNIIPRRGSYQVVPRSSTRRPTRDSSGAGEDGGCA